MKKNRIRKTIEHYMSLPYHLKIPTVPNEGRICSPVSGSGHITVSDAAEP